jgi:heme exporter protein D
MNYSSFAWVPLTVGLTILGLVLSYLTYQRRGLRPAMMVAAFSLLPIAALMTGAIEMLWKVGVAIGQFATGFVFSPEKWAGIGVTGLAVALFLAAGGRQHRKASREARRAARADRKDETEGRAGAPQIAPRSRSADAATRALSTDVRTPVPAERGAANAPAKASRKAAPVDDDMKDIEDILRKRGL